jgi:hypothetical protein
MTTTVISDETLRAIVEAGEKIPRCNYSYRTEVVNPMLIMYGLEMAQELIRLREEAYEQATDKSEMYHRLVAAGMITRDLLAALKPKPNGQIEQDILADSDLPDAAVEMERRFQATRRDEIVRERP